VIRRKNLQWNNLVTTTKRGPVKETVGETVFHKRIKPNGSFKRTGILGEEMIKL
jgi:hypothetical protein